MHTKQAHAMRLLKHVVCADARVAQTAALAVLLTNHALCVHHTIPTAGQPYDIGLVDGLLNRGAAAPNNLIFFGGLDSTQLNYVFNVVCPPILYALRALFPSGRDALARLPHSRYNNGIE